MCEFYEVQIMEMHHCTPIRSVSNLEKGNVLSFCKGATQGNKTQPSSKSKFSKQRSQITFFRTAAYKKNHFKLLQILLAVLVANKVGPV